MNILSNVYSEFTNLDLDEKYILRQPTMTDEDILAMYNIYNDPKVTVFVPDDCIPRGMEGAKEEARHYANIYLFGKSIYWFIARKDTNEAIGTCGFCDWDRHNSRLEIAYNVRGDYQNQGIATKAVNAAVKYGFDKMAAIRIQAQLDQVNIHSIHLLEKIGFQKDGVLRQYRRYKDNKHVDVLMMSCINSDYYKLI